MNDDPSKTAASPSSAHTTAVERSHEATRHSSLHQAVHTGVGIVESVSTPLHVADPSTKLHRFDEIAAVVLKVMTVVALVFGLFEYDRQKADGRVTESLALVQEWENGGYQEAYAKVNDLLQPEYQKAAPVIASMDDTGRAIALANIGVAVTGDDHSYTSEADRDVDKVFHFFERAAICADQAICDYPVLKTFFGSEASSFWLYFSRYAEGRQADGYAGYGEWTHRFVDGDIRRAKFLGIF